jgi:diguanylate cyclase (GGDEF)-like protein
MTRPCTTSLQENVTRMADGIRRNRQQLALLLVDVRQVRTIRELLGPDIGADLLQTVEHSLRSCIRGADTIERNGDDEFVILLSQITHEEDAALAAERILECLTASHRIQHHDLRFAVNIGIATFPDDGRTADALHSKAYSAMQAASAQGPDNYRFHRPFTYRKQAARFWNWSRILRLQPPLQAPQIHGRPTLARMDRKPAQLQ